jgi:hypothetical protein
MDDDFNTKALTEATIIRLRVGDLPVYLDGNPVTLWTAVRVDALDNKRFSGKRIMEAMTKAGIANADVLLRVIRVKLFLEACLDRSQYNQLPQPLSKEREAELSEALEAMIEPVMFITNELPDEVAVDLLEIEEEMFYDLVDFDEMRIRK